MGFLFGKQEELPSGLTWQDDDEVPSSEPVSSDVGASWTVECAWCLAAQGIVPQSGSHGICQFHSDQVMQQYRLSRGQRG